TGPTHDALFSITDRGQLNIRAMKGGTDQLVLLVGAVLEFIQENVAVCLAHGIADDITVFQDLDSERNQILESDLRALNPNCSDCVPGKEGVLPSQDWTKAVDQTLRKSVKGVAV